MKLPELNKSRWSLAVIGISFLMASMVSSFDSSKTAWFFFFIGVASLATSAYNHDNR